MAKDSNLKITITQSDISAAWEKALEIADKLDDLKAAETYLNGAGIQTCGIESVDVADERTANYINMGDTYEQTIVHDIDEGTYALQSWGDWVEQTENQYCEDNDVIRCAYCGQFTDLPEENQDENWYDTVCEYCEHYVDGRKRLDN